MSKEHLISLHNEKAGGTSALRIFEDQLGRQQIFLYNARNDCVIRYSDVINPLTETKIDAFRQYIRRNPHLAKIHNTLIIPFEKLQHWVPADEIANMEFAVIHGHFPADRFDGLIDGPIYTMLIRRPLARMIAQYLTWKNTWGRYAFRVHVPYDPTIQFRDFALLPELKNYQYQALAGKKLSQFILGVTGYMDDYQNRLQVVLSSLTENIKPIRVISPAPKLNQSPDYDLSSLGINSKFVRKFRVFHNLDYQLYYEISGEIKIHSK